MKSLLHILHLEDEPHDVELLQAVLHKEDIAFKIRQVETRDDFLAALEKNGFDLILADYTLPSFNGSEALKIVTEKCPDIPFVFVSGTMGEEEAIESLKSGATDYVLKKRMSRLVPAIKRALREAKERAERKQAEKELRREKEFNETVLNSLEQSICIINVHDFTILGVNKSFLQQMGMTKETVIGKTCYEVKHNVTMPCTSPEYDCPLNQTVKTGNSEVFEHVHYRKDGSKIYVETSTSPIRDENGEIIQVVYVERDITEQKHLQEQLFHAQKMEAVGHLAGGIAHDFNNILTAIIGYGNLIQIQMSKDDPLRSFVNQILASSQRAANLTRSLLAFSRKQIINPQPFNLNDVIKNVEKLLQRLISEDIELNLILTNTALIAKVDIGQIEQVLMNFASNARDAMPDGGTLTVETSQINVDQEYVKKFLFETPGRYAVISISDTGIGIEKAKLNQVFDPFFTTKEVGKGTGLGLSIVYGIIKQHGGDTNVYSEPGKGTTFIIYLPLTKSQSEVEEKVSTVLSPPKGGNETVLVAEDNECVRKLIKDVLISYGYKVVEAVDGEDAITVFRKNRENIQLILMDVIMPKKNGRKAYEEIKKTAPGIKVLFMSGYTANIVHKKGILEPDLPFVLKPVSPGDLLKKIREVLDR